MPSYELTEREKQSLAQADRLNAILNQSSIPNGAIAAQQRAKEQALERQQRSRNAQELDQLTGAQQFRAQENALNRDAAMDRVNKLTNAQRAAIIGGNQSVGNIDAAIDSAETVIDTGGEFKGYPDWAIGIMRDMGWNTVPNIVSDVFYSGTEKDARGKIVDATEQIRRALAGANLTGVEIGLQADSAPDAPGITMQESVRRLGTWRDKAQRAITAQGGQSSPQSAPSTSGLSDSARSYLR